MEGLDVAETVESDVTGGDRLENLVAGNLAIDSDGALTAATLGGEVQIDGHEGSEPVQAAIDDL